MRHHLLWHRRYLLFTGHLLMCDEYDRAEARTDAGELLAEMKFEADD